jgi:hypothetical protein
LLKEELNSKDETKHESSRILNSMKCGAKSPHFNLFLRFAPRFSFFKSSKSQSWIFMKNPALATFYKK